MSKDKVMYMMNNDLEKQEQNSWEMKKDGNFGTPQNCFQFLKINNIYLQTKVLKHILNT